MKAINFFYSLVVAIRRKLYGWGVLQSFRPKAYTISVGNTIAGGAGKTPSTLFLAELLQDKGPVAIILRPYKAEAERSSIPFQVDPSSHSSSFVGDEALLVAKRLPNVSVWVGKKAKAAQAAEKAGAKVLIVDDGFQHFALERDLDVVVIDAENHSCGLCREPLSSVKRANLLFINCRSIQFDTTAIKNELRRYTEAPIVTVSYAIDGFYNLEDIKLTPPKKAGLFCAIANPESFRKTIESQGIEVVDCLYGKDHASFTDAQLAEFSERVLKKGGQAIICTEKDRIKLTSSPLPIIWLKINLAVEKKGELAIIQEFFHKR